MSEKRTPYTTATKPRQPSPGGTGRALWPGESAAAGYDPPVGRSVPWKSPEGDEPPADDGRAIEHFLNELKITLDSYFDTPSDITPSIRWGVAARDMGDHYVIKAQMNCETTQVNDDEPPPPGCAGWSSGLLRMITKPLTSAWKSRWILPVSRLN